MTEPHCNHDPSAVSNGICECGAVTKLYDNNGTPSRVLNVDPDDYPGSSIGDTELLLRLCFKYMEFKLRNRLMVEAPLAYARYIDRYSLGPLLADPGLPMSARMRVVLEERA